MREVSVVYATDTNYLFGTLVSLTSLLINAKKETYYKVYILVDQSFSNKDIEIVEKTIKVYSYKCNISFVRVDDLFDDAYLQIDYISKVTYYRLLLPDLLREKKIIYLDGDTIIRCDLGDLYDTKMGNNLIAAVKAPSFFLRDDADYYCKKTGLPSLDNYVNVGVMIMNLEQMRIEKTSERLMMSISKEFDYQDQDVINVVCYGRIVFLDFNYNVMTVYSEWNRVDYYGIFTEKELSNAWNNPRIIHYAGREKPWNTPNVWFGDFWWSVCSKTPLYDEILNHMKHRFVNCLMYQNWCNHGDFSTKKTTPFFDISLKGNIVIYGAGKMAQRLYEELSRKKIKVNLFVVSSKDNNPDSLFGIDVKLLDDLGAREIENSTFIVAFAERYQNVVINKLELLNAHEIIPLSDNWRLV